MVEYVLQHTPCDLAALFSIAHSSAHKSCGEKEIKEYPFSPMFFSSDREREACSTPGNKVETIREERVTSGFLSQRAKRCE